MASEEHLREQAKKRLKTQRSFKVMLGVFVIVWVVCWALWYLGGAESHRGVPWPLWVMFGTGIAAAFGGWNAYGPRPQVLSDSAIDAEVKKMKD